MTQSELIRKQSEQIIKLNQEIRTLRKKNLKLSRELITPKLVDDNISPLPYNPFPMDPVDYLKQWNSTCCMDISKTQDKTS